MKAILLAAGYGTRLRPLTDRIPKCLVPIKGKPLLEIWLERLSDAGVSEFLINTHYLAEQVEDYVESSPWRDRVRLTHEGKLLGTAGTLIRNLNFFEGQDGLLIHADNYCQADLGAFLKAHADRPKNCLMTMMTFRTETPKSCGIIEVDQDGVVQGFHEKVADPPGNLANGAVYVLSAELLREIPNSMTDFSTGMWPWLKGRIQTYETRELFLDIGTPEAYARVS